MNLKPEVKPFGWRFCLWKRAYARATCSARCLPATLQAPIIF